MTKKQFDCTGGTDDLFSDCKSPGPLKGMLEMHKVD